jgi:hypothetical protein
MNALFDPTNSELQSKSIHVASVLTIYLKCAEILLELSAVADIQQFGYSVGLLCFQV